MDEIERATEAAEAARADIVAEHLASFARPREQPRHDPAGQRVCVSCVEPATRS